MQYLELEISVFVLEPNFRTHMLIHYTQLIVFVTIIVIHIILLLEICVYLNNKYFDILSMDTILRMSSWLHFFI